MSMPPAPLRTAEASGAATPGPLECRGLGRLVYPQRDQPVVRSGRHTGEYGWLVVRTPASAAAIWDTATYPVDEIRAVGGAGWRHGPRDTLLRPHPKNVTGFRLSRGEA